MLGVARVFVIKVLLALFGLPFLVLGIMLEQNVYPFSSELKKILLLVIFFGNFQRENVLGKMPYS